MSSTAIRPSTRREPTERYTGVLRQGTRIVAECGHTHANRDVPTRSGGTPAIECARDLLCAARNPGVAAARIERIRLSWKNVGAASTSGVDRAKAAAEQDAVEYEQLVARVREMLADQI